MKRCLAGWLTLFLLFAAVSGFALTYSVDPATGLYVDESGEVIAEYWDEGAGIYIVDGVAYPISNSDGGSASSGAAASEPVQNPDGGMEVTSSDQTGAFDSNAAAAAAQQGEEDGSTTGSAGLTPEEWRARMDKAMQANGVSTGTVYVDENGNFHAEPDTENGLKPAGFAMVEAMENLGVIIDVSHLNDAGIFDILKTVKKDTPVIASHSNARAVCPHPRNLTDEMLRQIAEHGGICGINFAYDFISDEKSESQLTTIDGMIRHMKYIRDVAGIDTIGFGSDFDGIGNPVEVKNAAGMQQIAQKMEDAGFTLDEIEKVFYKNALRVYKQVLG